jgi:gliding motility-associated-like protein
MKAIILFLCCCCFQPVFSQQISFQKILNPSAGIGDLQCFDGKQTSDGAYIFTGIGKFGASIYRPVLVKLDCKGNSIWAKNFAASSTIGNVMMKVIETKDSGYCMLNNIGQYGAYSMLLVRTDKNGNTLWKKIINPNAGDDIGQCIQQTSDGGFIIVGTTNSFGTEIVAGSYHDVYVIKVDGNGNAIWSKTIGNVSNIDEATAVVQTKDGGYAICGRYIEQSSFYSMLLKLDASGNVSFLKCFGKTQHANYGLDIAECSNTDLLICGATTLLQNNYQDYPDHFVIRCNAAGDTLWTKAYFGTNPNSFENPSNIFEESTGAITLGAVSASYPTIGFVPNKQMALQLQSDGQLLKAITYNDGGSHYSKCYPAKDGGYVINGFTTLGSPATFRTNFIKTPTDFSNVCGTKDVTNATGSGAPLFEVANPIFSTSSGANIINATFEASFSVTDTTICQNYPAIVAAFSVSSTCANSPVVFTSSTQGSAGYLWCFGNGDSAFTILPTTNYTYATPGNYTATLFVSNGCDVDSTKITFTVSYPPLFYIIQSPDPATEADIITLSTNVVATNSLWSNGSTTPSITVSQNGIYYITATINGCVVTDTINVLIQNIGLQGTIFIPNIITPNGDGNNDDLDIKTTGAYTLKSFSVYNRFGTQVYQNKDANQKFNGIYKGLPLENDVYFYYAIFTIGGREEIRKGDIMVIR